MSLEKTIQELRELLNRCSSDLQKTERGNRAAAQRVRTSSATAKPSRCDRRIRSTICSCAMRSVAIAASRPCSTTPRSIKRVSSSTVVRWLFCAISIVLRGWPSPYSTIRVRAPSRPLCSRLPRSARSGPPPTPRVDRAQVVEAAELVEPPVGGVKRSRMRCSRLPANR